MQTNTLGALLIGALSLGTLPVGCSRDAEPTAEEGSAEQAAPTPETATAAGAPIPGCGGGLELLEGNRLRAGDRTVDCGELGQLLSDQVIDHACLGAIAKNGGRACIERYVAESRDRSRVLRRGIVTEPAAEEPEP